MYNLFSKCKISFVQLDSFGVQYQDRPEAAARMLLSALREKNCPFGRKTVASWSLCSRRATLWASIYCGSGIAGGLDASTVVLK